MKILVTGGAGFIGSHLVDYLISLNHYVCIVDNLSTGRLQNVNKKASFYQMDIADPKLIELFLDKRPEIVYHLAAQISVPESIKDPLTDAQTNITGTLNLLDACRIYNVKKIIYSSSAAVYGNASQLPITEESPIMPVSPYGISKYTVECYLKIYAMLYGLNYTILRYANVYGERQNSGTEGGVVAIFADKLSKSVSVEIYGDGEQTRDFIYVKDVVSANIAALTNGNNDVFNIGTGRKNSINVVYNTMKRILNTYQPPIYAKKRSGDLRDSYFNIEKAKKLLIWEPEYLIYEGLERYLSYLYVSNMTGVSEL